MRMPTNDYWGRKLIKSPLLLLDACYITKAVQQDFTGWIEHPIKLYVTCIWWTIERAARGLYCTEKSDMRMCTNRVNVQLNKIMVHFSYKNSPANCSFTRAFYCHIVTLLLCSCRRRVIVTIIGWHHDDTRYLSCFLLSSAFRHCHSERTQVTKKIKEICAWTIALSSMQTIGWLRVHYLVI